MKEQEEEARLKRVEEYGRKAMRRIMQQGLARGWEAWQQQYLEHVGKQRMLKTVASRLMKPKLSASFTHWWHDWEDQQRSEEVLSQAGRLRSKWNKIEEENARLREQLEEVLSTCKLAQ